MQLFCTVLYMLVLRMKEICRDERDSLNVHLSIKLPITRSVSLRNFDCTCGYKVAGGGRAK